jgi:hypothetical protein
MEECCGIKFLVEANSFERLSLWNERGHYSVPWGYLGVGYSFEIGSLDNRPVIVVIWPMILNSKRIAFWDCCSQVMDRAMIDRWFDKQFPDAPRCDAMNFHLCADAVR